MQGDWKAGCVVNVLWILRICTFACAGITPAVPFLPHLFYETCSLPLAQQEATPPFTICGPFVAVFRGLELWGPHGGGLSRQSPSLRICRSQSNACFPVRTEGVQARGFYSSPDVSPPSALSVRPHPILKGQDPEHQLRRI